MKGFLFALHVLFSLCVARSFKVWAPHASSVLVVSKNWSVELGKTFDGTFLGATSEAQIGDLYQFLIDGALRRVDPTSQEREGEFSIIHNSSFVWKSKSNLTVPSRLVVYELHIPSFSEEGTFDGAAKKLPFLKSLGVNMVELMPVSDFFGPSNGWGYNPTGLLRCVMKKFGGRESSGSRISVLNFFFLQGALGLKRFVDEAHLLGIGVALDVVFNHFDPGNLLLDFDSNSSQYGNGIFFYNQQGYSMTYWGPRPNFGSKHIVSFLLETLQTFVSEFRIDGFRFDSTVCIRKPGQSCWTNPQNNSEGIAFLQSCNQLLSNFFTTAEDDQGQSIVVRPIAQGGLGFKTQWGYKGFYYTFESLLTYSDNNSINVSLISNLIESSIEGPRVLFTENHDMASNQNKGRIPKIVDPNGSGENPSYWAAKKAMMGISGLILFARIHVVNFNINLNKKNKSWLFRMVCRCFFKAKRC